MSNSFLDYNFSQAIDEVLASLKFEQPTAIQKEIIPLLRQKQNVVGISQTGSGKTHAFLLPLLEKIDFANEKPQALIMVPTRELANQIYQNLKEFMKAIPQLKVSLLIGGKDLDESKIIASQLIIGTPGRLFDAMTTRHVLKVDQIEYFVIDEADMIFDENFLKDVDKIMGYFNDNVCFSIFSATITKTMHPFLKNYFENIKIVEIKGNNENIEHIIIPSKGQDKYQTLLKLTKVIDPYLCLIFASKKEDVIRISEQLNSDGITCIQLHGDLSARERTKTLKRINNLEFKYIVASDIAARGIDIDGVSHVISIDMPKEIEYYIHRSGRTGRHQYTGISYFIYDNSDEKSIKKIERKGISFAYYDFSKDGLVFAGLRNREQKTLKQDFVNPELLGKLKPKKKEQVKPGYKKKRKQELERIRKKAKQQEIREKIRRQKKQRKNNNEDSFK
ncbi:DEAD/DEAH box helicase [Erysipelotrichaceae bacterium OttesenSCG-928-M19]|nr:DEAD/DEAH box helicase [Erysipelotrichaceae bacterium OttesenSCG-928-M19]